MDDIKVNAANAETFISGELEPDNLQIEGLGDKEAKEFKLVLTRFVKSYTKKPKDMTDKEWLANEFRREFPEKSDEEIEKLSTDAAEAVAEYDANLADLNKACAEGESKESWFEKKTREAAIGMSVQDYGSYLQSLNNAVENANEVMAAGILTQNNTISGCRNLDGFIAEQYHAATFNANAILKGSDLRAIARIPAPGEPYIKNSVDVVVRDNYGAGSIKARYQSKYGADGKATNRLFKRGDYSFQQKLVPKGQSEAINAKTTEVISVDGIESKPLSKASAKELKELAQKDKLFPQIDYNAFNIKELALQLGKNAAFAGVQAAVISTGFNLAARAFSGDKIEGDEVVETALKTGADAGIKAAATGALHVGIEKGIINVIPKGTPVGMLANIVCVGIENVKIMGKIATGELTPSQGLDRMGRTTTAMLYGLSWGAAGMKLGAITGGVIGTLILPGIGTGIGTVIGSLVGSMVGYIAGAKVGETIYNGFKKVCGTAKKIVKSTWEGIKKVGNKIKAGWGKIFS